MRKTPLTAFHSAAIALAASLLSVALPARAHAADPAVPPGLDPGGSAIAIITTGIDYTDPLIAQSLARDGEGQLIGWDFVDNDITPYANNAEDEALAKLARQSNPRVRLVIVRVKPGNLEHLVNAAKFIDRTPARIVAMPHAAPGTQERAMIDKIARVLFKRMFFAGPAELDDLGQATNERAPQVAQPASGNHWPPAEVTEFFSRARAVAPLQQIEGILQNPGGKRPTWTANVDAWVKSAATREQAVIIAAAQAACAHTRQPQAPGEKETSNALRNAFEARKTPHAADPQISVLLETCEKP